MGKLTGPLFSLGASGAIGKTLVYFPWKGINAVREYVVPANPRTTDQVAQRGHLEDAVDEWHASAYTADDVTAWNRLAGVAAKIMSGFNRMVQEFVNEIILGNTWERLWDVETSNVFADMFRATVTKAAGGNAPTLHWGTRKTHFPNSVAMTDDGGDSWHGDATPLNASTLYYFYIDVGTSETDYARTGIYQQRTIA